MDIKEKIEKLLRLGQSPNENEAKAAMLKARELMMQHKLSEKDFEDVKKEEIIRYKTGIFYTVRSRSWVWNLICVIAPNYGCNTYLNKTYGKQKSEVIICGFKSDVDVCTQVFKYACDCVDARMNEMKKGMKGMNAYERKSYCLSYASGFRDGLEKSYKKQTEEKEQEWGLVAVIDPEVEAITASMKKTKQKNDTFFSESCYANGLKDGESFTTRNKLEESYAN
ncbi:MAG: hypothetical protein EUB_02610 [Eubacterium sp.]|uniref:DUF2786 domain-containing protein n=1 Tax=Eubacterium sp. TaxID=142586 RepID=UPI003052473C